MDALTHSVFLIPIIICWTIISKILAAFALWKSAGRKQGAWFVCLIIFHTTGILPLIYLLIERDRPTNA